MTKVVLWTLEAFVAHPADGSIADIASEIGVVFVTVLSFVGLISRRRDGEKAVFDVMLQMNVWIIEAVYAKIKARAVETFVAQRNIDVLATAVAIERLDSRG